MKRNHRRLHLRPDVADGLLISHEILNRVLANQADGEDRVGEPGRLCLLLLPIVRLDDGFEVFLGGDVFGQEFEFGEVSEGFSDLEDFAFL